MKAKIMIASATVCLTGFLAACGSPLSSTKTPPPDDFVSIKSFTVSQGLVRQGSDFRLAWSTSSTLPTIGSLYLSHAQNPEKDNESQHIMTLTCGSYSACDWNGEALCSIDEDMELSCTDPVTEKTSTAINVDRFKGDVYLVFEACAALECEKATQKITIQ